MNDGIQHDLNSLIEACLENNEQAWAIFFKRFGPYITKSIETVLPPAFRGGPKDRINVVRDIFAAVYCNIRAAGERGGLPRPGAIHSWLKTIARNETISWHRRQHRRIQLVSAQAEWGMCSMDEPLQQEDDHRTLHDILAAPQETTPSNFNDPSGDSEILNYLKELPERDLWVLRLRYIYYWRPDEETRRSLAAFTRISLADAQMIIDRLLEMANEKKQCSEKELADAACLAAEVKKMESTKHITDGSDISSPQNARNSEIERKRRRMYKLIKSAGRDLFPPRVAIAKVLGISENNVSVIHTRLKTKLRQIRKERVAETKNRNRRQSKLGDHEQT